MSVEITEIDPSAPDAYLEVLSEDTESQKILARLGFPVSAADFESRVSSFPTWLRIFVAYNSSTPVGSITVTGADNLKLRDAAIIADIRVKKDYRRRHIGSQLVEHALEFIRSVGVERVVTIVSEMNIAGLRLYHRFGMRAFNVFKDYYVPGENALALELYLNKDGQRSSSS
ncbi:MAG: GNAT family N-acetyltransferase [Thermoprotei archaeon]